jgi:hypothetical protein
LARQEKAQNKFAHGPPESLEARFAFESCGTAFAFFDEVKASYIAAVIWVYECILDLNRKLN